MLWIFALQWRINLPKECDFKRRCKRVKLKITVGEDEIVQEALS